MKLCINSRDELRLIELDEVVYLKACGNYTDFHFKDAHVMSETNNLFAFTQQIEELYSNLSDSPFLRVGRSYVVNMNYVSLINIPKRMIQFRIPAGSFITLPKNQCANLRNMMLMKYKNVSSPESLQFKP